MLANVINASIARGSVPELMKVEHVRPLLKKPWRLSFSNITSRSYQKCLRRWCREASGQQLQEAMQSAYRPRYSMESAILRVTNDFLRAVDRQRMTILVLLDLSAAFETIDHERLLHRMSTPLNVKDCAKLVSLHLRSQVVAIEANIFDSRNLDYGVNRARFFDRYCLHAAFG